MKKLFSVFLATAISMCAVAPCYAYEDVNATVDMGQSFSTTTIVDWTETYDSLRDVVENSDICLVGSVSSQEIEMRGDLYFTHSYINTEDGNTYDVLQTGAVVNGVEVNVPYDAALMETGDEYFLCLNEVNEGSSDQYYLITGGNQGYGEYDANSDLVTEMNLTDRSVYQTFQLNNIETYMLESSSNIAVTPRAITPQSPDEYYWVSSEIACCVRSAIGNTYGDAAEDGIRAGVTAWNSTNAPYVYVTGSTPSNGITVNMGDYGATGWDGQTTTNWNSSTHAVTSATIYLSTHYLGSYLDDEGLWQALACHEMGHALGLDHNETVTRTIMRERTIDYYNYRGSSPKYTRPQSVDISGINAIYG